MVSHNFTEVPSSHSASNKRRHNLWLKWKGFVRSKFKSLHHRAATSECFNVCRVSILSDCVCWVDIDFGVLLSVRLIPIIMRP